MSYMDHNATFANAGGVQELSFNEIDAVDGGIIPAIVAFAATPAGAAAIRVGFALGTIAAIALIDYFVD
jgi:lactobin A/cerein 7B family class IIb bacteriocin